MRPQCGPHLKTAKQFSELHAITLVNVKLYLSAAQRHSQMHLAYCPSHAKRIMHHTHHAQPGTCHLTASSRPTTRTLACGMQIDPKTEYHPHAARRRVADLPDARSARASTSCTMPSGRALGSCERGFCGAPNNAVTDLMA